MAHILASATVAEKGSLDSRDAESLGTSVSLIADLLRDAIAESGWKHEALASAMDLPNAAYLSRMLSGEKPIGARHLRALPDDVEAIFAQKYAETFGLIVVAPSHGQDAVKQLVSGLFGVLGAASLPARADRMARATLPPLPRRAVR